MEGTGKGHRWEGRRKGGREGDRRKDERKEAGKRRWQTEAIKQALLCNLNIVLLINYKVWNLKKFQSTFLIVLDFKLRTLQWSWLGLCDTKHPLLEQEGFPPLQALPASPLPARALQLPLRESFELPGSKSGEDTVGRLTSPVSMDALRFLLNCGFAVHNKTYVLFPEP